MAVANTDGLLLRINFTLLRWLGYEAADLVGKRRTQDLFSVGARVFHQTHCVPLLQVQGSVGEVQIEMVHQDRRRIPVLMNVVRRKHNNTVLDEFAFFVANDRRSYERELLLARKGAENELTARLTAEHKLREMNEQLKLADRRKDEFLATLAHELRNPLAPMRNVLEIFKLHAGNESSRSWALSVLDRQLHQLTHLVDDLMDVSRITQGRMELRRQAVDLRTILGVASEDVRGMMEAAFHTFKVDLPDDALMVHVDPTRITQVIVNLLTNAAKYTPEGGQIVLRVKQEKAEAVVSVSDTGIGIPEESLATVFDMFSQLSPALERSQGGLGIGLALVRGLVQLHGGSVSVTSQGVGKGSEFIVRLPLTEAATQADSPKLSNTGAQPFRILVIDDNIDSAESMTMALELLGYEAQAAHDGHTGLQSVERLKPNVILLDIGLPDLNGYEVARRIRSLLLGKDVFLIAATGWGQEADKQLALDAGFDCHLTKPVDFHKLQELLVQHLGQGRR
ncbi:ATP-binding protein [Noviherbaspirillum sp. 1P10PC]|uniref:hybrid sensor histidine kinase/response regulator n=1 Tax=Noviherbaspirillum sp. 1P10PC TaxID=3132292 RepID=UPI0039A00DCB